MPLKNKNKLPPNTCWVPGTYRYTNSFGYFFLPFIQITFISLNFSHYSYNLESSDRITFDEQAPLCYNVTKNTDVFHSGDDHMREKIQNKISNMNKVSKNILKYGLFFCLILLIIANILLYTASDYHALFIGRELTEAAFVTIAEICIGALIFDYCKENV